MAESETEARVLQFLLGVLNSQLRLDQLVPTILDMSLQLTGAERGFVMLYHSNGELTIQSARNNKKQDLSEKDFQASNTVIRKTLQDKKSLYVRGLNKNKEFSGSRSVRELGLQSVICIPLWLRSTTEKEDSTLMGVLYLDSSSTFHPLRENHLQLMDALANHVAVSMKNARLFEELENKNTQIDQLNRQLEHRVEMQQGNITEMKMLLNETQRELGRVYGLGNVIGQSTAMQSVFHILEKVVRTDATVLIQGESGTGKELVAKYIHYNGARATKPMVSINCAAFHETLLESELFGHRKGAFTGADENKIGLFQVADGGSLFMDEVGDMDVEMQKKLLRVLQNGEIRPVGGKEVLNVNVRIIAATHHDLQQLVRDGKFREDLYFRLNVINIQVPPLRERAGDIPILVDFFTGKISTELGRTLQHPPESIIKRFIEYDWPGNVRELENELRRYFILESEYRPERLQPHSADWEEKSTLDSMERNAIVKALETTHGNKTTAAEMLGISRRAFYEKLKRYGIN